MVLAVPPLGRTARSQPYRNRAERRRVLTRRSGWPSRAPTTRRLTCESGRRRCAATRKEEPLRSGRGAVTPERSPAAIRVVCRPTSCAAEPRTECGDAMARSVPGEVLAITGALQAGWRDRRRAERLSAALGRAGRSCDLRCHSSRGEEIDRAIRCQIARSARAKGPAREEESARLRVP